MVRIDVATWRRRMIERAAKECPTGKHDWIEGTRKKRKFMYCRTCNKFYGYKS